MSMKIIPSTRRRLPRTSYEPDQHQFAEHWPHGAKEQVGSPPAIILEHLNRGVHDIPGEQREHGKIDNREGEPRRESHRDRRQIEDDDRYSHRRGGKQQLSTSTRPKA